MICTSKTSCELDGTGGTGGGSRTTVTGTDADADAEVDAAATSSARYITCLVPIAQPSNGLCVCRGEGITTRTLICARWDAWLDVDAAAYILLCVT